MGVGVWSLEWLTVQDPFDPQKTWKAVMGFFTSGVPGRSRSLPLMTRRDRRSQSKALFAPSRFGLSAGDTGFSAKSVLFGASHRFRVYGLGPLMFPQSRMSGRLPTRGGKRKASTHSTSQCLSLAVRSDKHHTLLLLTIVVLVTIPPTCHQQQQQRQHHH